MNRCHLATLLCLLACLLLVGCGREPRTRDEIFQERLSLPQLYLTADSHQQVTASGTKGVFVDADSGEICFRAKECLNPDCPGFSGGKPVLFFDVDPTKVIQPDGSIGDDASKIDLDLVAGCPECLRQRKLRTETPEEQQKYIQWSRPHILPETAKREAELDAELKSLEP
jgi:hypothetical protein